MEPVRVTPISKPEQREPIRSEFLLSLINAVADPIFVKDRHHRWILLNDAFCSFIGARREDLIGKSDYDFFPAAEADVFWEMDRAVFETGEVNENEEHFTDRTGITRTILTRKSRYVDPSGEMYLIGTIRDVSRAKEAETQRMQLALESHARAEAERQKAYLQESANRLQEILDALPVAVFILGPAGEVASTNEAVSRIWRGKGPPIHNISDYQHYRGWHPELGKPIEPEEWAGARAIREGKSVVGEVVDVQWFDGTYGTILNSAVPLRNAKGEIDGAIVVNHDITALKAVESELRTAKEDAEAASRVKSEFLDIASHELRTPLTPLLLLTDTAIIQAASGLPVKLEHLERIKRQIVRLNGLVADLLDATRLERGTLALHLTDTDLVSLIRDCVKDFEGRMASRQLTMQSDQEALRMTLDPVRIYQVIANFLDNALRYTPEGSPIEVCIRATLPESVRIEVIDHGPGIPVELQAKLFQRFQRIGGDSALRHPGLGLGLYICSQIGKLHGGRVGIRSGLGPGSVFFLELPIRNQNAS